MKLSDLIQTNGEFITLINITASTRFSFKKQYISEVEMRPVINKSCCFWSKKYELIISLYESHYQHGKNTYHYFVNNYKLALEICQQITRSKIGEW